MKYLFTLLLVGLSVSALAQKEHFIYLQADNRQPFYIKLDKKILSSTASGYLIIPKLQDTSYELSIGFPKNEWPEQKVTCTVNNKDAGYLLKNFGEKGWGLFNFQTMDLVMAEVKPADDPVAMKKDSADAFTRALSNVVNDPNILVKEEVKKDSVTEGGVTETTVIKKGLRRTSKNKGKELAVNKKAKVTKLLSRTNADSLKIVYVDRLQGEKDTINVIIPIDKPAPKIHPEKRLVKVDKVIAANNKPAKKIKTPRTDLAKNAIPVKDSAVNLPAIKTEEHVTDIAKTDNKIVITDSTTTVQPLKKMEELKTDIAKNDTANNNNTINTVVEKKAEEPKLDTLKTVTTVTISGVDSTAMAKTEIKTEEPKPALVKEDIKEPAVQPVYSTITTNAIVKTDTVAKAPLEPVVTPAKTNSVIVEDKPKEIINSSNMVYHVCKYVADGDEFLSLRKKMSKSKSDNEMLYHAHMQFLKKCFTVKQIERLSILLSNDLGKYNLFDDAYHYVMDPENFPSLEKLLTDEYYIKRFKAMIR